MKLWDIIDQVDLKRLADQLTPAEFVVLCLLGLVTICIFAVALNSLYGHRGRGGR